MLGSGEAIPAHLSGIQGIRNAGVLPTAGFPAVFETFRVFIYALIIPSTECRIKENIMDMRLIEGKLDKENALALKLMLENPDRFRPEEFAMVAMEAYELRLCSVCGRFMNEGYFVECGPYYCSEGCSDRDGWTPKERTAGYYGLNLYSDEVREAMERMSPEEFEKWCMEIGDEDDSTIFWTEWDAPTDLVGRLNGCLEKEVC